MAQLFQTSWTNPSSAVAKNISVGFAPVRVTTYDITNGAAWVWVYGMTAGYCQRVDTGAMVTSNGFTPLAESTLYGAPITAISKSSTTAFTCSYLDQFAFAVGDVVKATEIADDGTGITLNGSYTVSVVSATQITCTKNTTAGYSVWVSGGYLSRVSDINGYPVYQKNFAIQGGTIGTTMVGANSAAMLAIFEGQMNVV